MEQTYWRRNTVNPSAYDGGTEGARTRRAARICHKFRIGVTAFILLFPIIVSAADTICIADQALGCKDRKTWDEIRTYVEDPAAFQRAYAVAIVSGLCRQFERNVKVYKDDVAIFAEMRQVHLPGDLDKYWVLTKQTTDDDASCATAARPLPEPEAKPRAQTRATQTTNVPASSLPKSDSRKSTSSVSAGANASTCEFKPIMTDEEIRACR